MINCKNSSLPGRIQRWVLRFQSCDFTVKYRPGTEYVTDALSRLSINVAQKTCDAEDQICFIAKNALPNAITMQEVEKESANGPEPYFNVILMLGSVYSQTVNGNW